MNENFATKADIQVLDTKIERVGIDLSHQIQQLRSDLIIRLGSMMVVSVGVVATVMKFVRA